MIKRKLLPTICSSCKLNYEERVNPPKRCKKCMRYVCETCIIEDETCIIEDETCIICCIEYHENKNIFCCFF